jgi:hypothetical protein
MNLNIGMDLQSGEPVRLQRKYNFGQFLGKKLHYSREEMNECI